MTTPNTTARQAGLMDSTVAEVMADCEAFEAAMVEAGFNRPDIGRHLGMYRYQRDQDRFTGWKIARSTLAAHSADARNMVEGVALRGEKEAAYNSIDRFLRNNLCDEDYAEYSAELDSLIAAPAAPAPEPAAQAGEREAFEAAYAAMMNAQPIAERWGQAPYTAAEIAAMRQGDAYLVGHHVLNAGWALWKAVRQQSATPAEPVVWCLVNARGQLQTWLKPYYFDPTGGGIDCVRTDSDKHKPDEAPFRWQPAAFTPADAASEADKK